jgi:hypothetical protein
VQSLHGENSVEGWSKSLGGGEEEEGRGWTTMAVVVNGMVVGAVTT